MTNLGTLVTRISARLKDPNFTAVTRAEVIAVINDAISFYSNERFRFNEFEEQVNLTTGNPELTLVTNTTPERIFKTNGIVVVYGKIRWRLAKVSSQEYDALNVEGTGIPFAWTYRDGKYYVYYYPSGDFAAIVRGLKAYTALSADSDSNDFTEKGDRLIMYETLSRLYSEFRQDDKMESYYTAKAKAEFDSLKASERAVVGTGKIQVGEL